MVIKEMVFDKDLYPPNFAHIGTLINALLSGVSFPPIIVERGTNRIIDGVHRWNAYKKVNGEDAEVIVEERTYANDNEAWQDAVEANANHGLIYSSYDRTRILVEADKRGITREVIGGLIHTPVDKLEKKLAGSSGFVKRTVTNEGKKNTIRERVALRTGLKGLAGRTLNRKQEDANKRVGLKASYCASTLLELLDADLFKWCSDGTKLKLTLLSESLAEKIAEAKPTKSAGIKPKKSRTRN